MKKALVFDQSLEIINHHINQIQFNYKPASLFQPISYILSLGGKRVRPALVLMAYSLYKNDYEKALPAALAVEIFHNFTLLHDDLMDKATMRRGKPTVHIKWNDNLAILSGDAMLIEAYKEISKVSPELLPKSLEIFSKIATEICCGQQLDMEFESRLDVSADEYLEMIKLKTAVLLGGALQLGALLGGASEKNIDMLYEFGTNIGLAFQLMDDILDVYGNSSTFGKRIGGDILCNKKTFMLISALRDEREKENLCNWINKETFAEDEKIKAVTNIYNKLKIKEKAEDLVQNYYDKSIEALDAIDLPYESKIHLYDIARILKERKA